MEPHMIGVTGASGFVGKAVCEKLKSRGHTPRPIVRQQSSKLPLTRVVGDIGAETAWQEALYGLNCVIHCAAHVHQMNAPRTLALDRYREVNTLGTLRLAAEAAKAKVKRLVFISSVKVMGEHTAPGLPFEHTHVPSPVDPYGLSKWEAEQGLWDISQKTGLEIVVIRPPLVYGPGVGANFRQLMRWIANGIPLPVSAIHNKRSLVALPNLTDLIEICAVHPAAPGQTFLASDGQDLSTPELVDALARAMGRSPRRFPLPPSLLKVAGSLIGRSNTVARLTQSLQVDIGHTRSALNWSPACSIENAMALTAQAFLNE